MTSTNAKQSLLQQIGCTHESHIDAIHDAIIGKIVMLANPIDRGAYGVGLIVDWEPPMAKASEPYGEACVQWTRADGTEFDWVLAHELVIVDKLVD